MTALPDWHVVADAELVSAALAGDRRAFAAIYDRYADALHDFCIGMLRDPHTAADCVHDVFCTAATRLDTLNDAAKLRPWLYTVARRQALSLIAAARREQPADELPEPPSTDPDPETLAARTELAELIAEAAGGLSDRDRDVLDLTYRHGLDGPELAEALGVSPGTANRMVSRLRATIETSLGALLIARRGQATGSECAELRALLAGWDGRFTILMRKRVARHLETCPTCDAERRRLVSPTALLGAVPLLIPAPGWLRDHTLSDVQLTAADVALDGSAGSGGGDTVVDAGAHPAARRRVLAAGLLAVLLGAAALTIVLMRPDGTAVAPVDVTGSTSAAPSTAPTSPPVPLIVPPTALDTTAASVTTSAVTSTSLPAWHPATTNEPPPPPPPPHSSSTWTSATVATTIASASPSRPATPTTTVHAGGNNKPGRPGGPSTHG